MSEKEKIKLGSGHIYVAEYNNTMPTDVELETESNRLGFIQSGAVITYKPTFYEVKDDIGRIDEIYITEEEITLKTGILTWNGDTLEFLCSTARVSEAGGVRTVKIGGLHNDNHKKYVIRFVHISGAVRTTIIGSNQAGFELAFAKDKETVINAEFKALKELDSDGTKLIYSETLSPLEGLTVTSIAAEVNGKSTITIAESLTEGNSFVYKVAPTIAVDVIYGQDLTFWASLISGNDYKIKTGDYITVAEITADGAAVKAGNSIITSKA